MTLWLLACTSTDSVDSAVDLQSLFAGRQPRRAAFQHRAKGDAVPLSEGGAAKAFTKTVSRHGVPRYRGAKQ